MNHGQDTRAPLKLIPLQPVDRQSSATPWAKGIEAAGDGRATVHQTNSTREREGAGKGFNFGEKLRDR